MREEAHIVENKRLNAEAKRHKSKWDNRFLILARHISTWSKDPSTKVGAVIVRADHTVVSLGYNGFPRGVNDDPTIYANRPEKYGRVVHAEMNAILTSGERLTDCTLYVWPLPTCDRCAASIIQSGIKRVVWAASPLSPGECERWGEPVERALDMYRQAGVVVDVVEVPGE